MGDIAGLLSNNLSVQFNGCVVKFGGLVHVADCSSIASAEYAKGFLGEVSLFNHPLCVGQKGEGDIKGADLKVEQAMADLPDEVVDLAIGLTDRDGLFHEGRDGIAGELSVLPERGRRMELKILDLQQRSLSTPIRLIEFTRDFELRREWNMLQILDVLHSLSSGNRNPFVRKFCPT